MRRCRADVARKLKLLLSGTCDSGPPPGMSAPFAWFRHWRRCAVGPIESVASPCELHSRRSRQECPSCAEAGVAAEPALARASDDERERRLSLLLLDEGSIRS